MGCFLGCFGFSGKRRRRKPANKVSPRDHRLGSYEPLDSSVSLYLDSRSSDSQLSCSNKITEISSVRIGKKVSFNLNVQTYETLTNDETKYELSESDEDEKMEKNGEGLANGSLCFVSDGDSTVSKMGAFPGKHRYQNCRDSYDDEDDDMAYTESDLDDEDDDRDDAFEYENDIEDQGTRQNEFLQQVKHQSVESSERNRISNYMQLQASKDGETISMESKRNARDRSQYLNSVLNPVENLTQWKAVKARTAVPKHPRKENIGLEQEAKVPFDLKPNHNQSKHLPQEIAVDASLSNWLASPNFNKSKTRSITNSSSGGFSVETIPLNKSIFDRSCSQQSREDRPIIDITNLKA